MALTRLQLNSFVWRSKQQAETALLLGDQTTHQLTYKLSGLPRDHRGQFEALIKQDAATRKKVRQVLSTAVDSLTVNQQKAVAMSISSTAKMIRLYAEAAKQSSFGDLYDETLVNINKGVSEVSKEVAKGALGLAFAASPVLAIGAVVLAVMVIVKGKLLS